jgi:uncharacterized protein YjbJ (UPF0337 family)
MSAFTDKVRGNWNVVVGKLKQEYGDLTDNDLVYMDGKEDELLGNLQRKTGQTREQLEKFINSSI